MCFGSALGDHFTVTVRDDSGRRVGGIIRIDGSGPVLTRRFCGTSGRIPVVSGELRVYLDAPGDTRDAHWFGGPGCAEMELGSKAIGRNTIRTTRGATSGRVIVRFTEEGW